MKKIMSAIMLILVSISPLYASDSLDLGVRAGAIAGHSSYITEVFGDLFLNRLVSVGGVVAYQVIDHDSSKSAKRDESMPITVLVKVHAPVPILNPYAGLGQAIIFHDKKSATGSPTILAGLDVKPFPMPVFVNLEYRHQLNGAFNIIAGGIGVKF